MAKRRAARTKAEPSKLAVGATIAISVSSGACYTMIASISIFGTVLAESEKAVQVEVENARPWKTGKAPTLWIPKSALIEPPPLPPHAKAYWDSVGGKPDPMLELADWFKFDAYGQRVIDRIEPFITAINAPLHN